MPDFIPGLKLSRLYYEEAVRPILHRHFPQLLYSAGLIGPGSEVLGFDTEMSTDHDWAPRVILFLSKADSATMTAAIHKVMANELPLAFRGYPTQLVPHPADPGAKQLQAAEKRPIEHHQVVTANLSNYVHSYTGINLERGITLVDWLLVPEQRLLALTAGPIFHDGLGVGRVVQERLAYYPRDVWLYLLAAQWQRIGQEESFFGRAGSVGDESGSAIIAARLVRDFMRLCFLMEKQYAPYSKWFGSAFGQLNCAAAVNPILEAILHSQSWTEREQQFRKLYEIIASMHNDLRISAPISTTLSQFYSRPFQVMQGGAIAEAIAKNITDEVIKTLPDGVGKIDQFIDNTDILSNVTLARKLVSLYGNATDVLKEIGENENDEKGST